MAWFRGWLSTRNSALTGEGDTTDPIQRIVRDYGDLLFDLCESVLWSPANAQLALHGILKRIRRERHALPFTDHERAWVLRIAVTRLLTFARSHQPRLSASEQIELDSAESASHRLRQFDSYFHRLEVEDQILMLLRDKYGIPFSEIATAMSVPEGSLKIRRQQALRSLEDWLWGSSSP